MELDSNEDQLPSVEIPPYFLCPITLHIMKDPVTTITGITYDRHSIRKWISNSIKANLPPLCPVTNQPLFSVDLIPNHTLRRLINDWSCTAAARVDRIPTPASVMDETEIWSAMRVLENKDVETAAFLAGLTRLEEVFLGSGVEINRVLIAGSDVPRLMLELLVRCSMKRLSECVNKCLVVLNGVWSCYHPTHDFKTFVEQNSVDLVHHLLSSAAAAVHRRNNCLSGHHALFVMKRVIELTSSYQLQFLNKDFFSKMVKFFVINTHQSTSTIQVLQILIHLCSNARSRTSIMEAGTIQSLIELQLCNPPTHKRTADVIFNLLSLLCHYVEGRERFLAHPCSLALLAELLLRVSPVVDEWILEIISLVLKFSGRKEIVTEMLQVGVVSKLCMVMQADCADYLKAKARKVLRMHWSSWNGSPCISLCLLTMHHSWELTMLESHKLKTLEW